MKNQEQLKWNRRLVTLSFLMLFFTIPHTLEDFSIGAPQEAGIPVSVLATVISFIFFLQAIGLYWLGQKKSKGLYVHIVLGLFWSIASGVAQLPVILNSNVYRSGLLSKTYVFGMILIGVLMVLVSIKSLRVSKSKS